MATIILNLMINLITLATNMPNLMIIIMIITIQCYKEHKGRLEYKHKVVDRHRIRWQDGDWTDDSDQMILIMDSICDNKGQVGDRNAESVDRL